MRGSEEELPAIDAARRAGLLPPIPEVKLLDERPVSPVESGESVFELQAAPAPVIDIQDSDVEIREVAQDTSEETLGKAESSKPKQKKKRKTSGGKAKSNKGNK
jgi:hypothetical protein